jgi:Raf kinase inhibitor-like YbhB/YbcL family protein
MAFRITSPAFADGADIPLRHTCDGDNLSPRLTWTDVPEGTRSFALVVDDPDAPGGTFTHWLLYDMPADGRELGQGGATGTSGRNSFGRNGYGGPCPPHGDPPHRYRFTLHALDVPSLGARNGTREEVNAKIQGHVIGTAQLVGLYQRQRR